MAVLRAAYVSLIRSLEMLECGTLGLSSPALFCPCFPWGVADDDLYGEVCLSLGAFAVAAHGWHGGLVGVEFERVGEHDPFERLVVVVGPAGYVALFDFDGGDVVGQ